MGEPAVSIVVPVFNRVELTRQCLDVLLSSRPDAPHEIIVSDDGSTDGTPALLASLGRDVRIVGGGINRGFASACNLGADAARAPFVVFLNNDTIPGDGWLDALFEVARSDASVAVVGSRLLYPDGTIQHAGVAMSRIFRAPYHFYRGVPGDHPIVNRRRELRMVTGACMLVRSRIFRSAGGFDTSYRNGFEDVDLCLRIRARGGRVVYEPASVLTHLESKSPTRHAHEKQNANRFQARFAGPQWTDEDLIYFEDGVRTHAVYLDEKVTAAPLFMVDEAEHAACAHVARVQESLHVDGRGRVEATLDRPESWPREPSFLEWGEVLAGALGLRASAEAFRVLAEQAASSPRGATGAPWATRMQLRCVRADTFGNFDARDIPRVPFWPRAALARARGVRSVSGDPTPSPALASFSF